MNIIGITGKAGAGKDTVAEILIRKHGFERIALADGMKRFLREIYDFSTEQLWGPSDRRNEPDKRYPRAHHEWHGDVCLCCGERTLKAGENPGTRCYLTPRYALQLLGTEWGRHCYEDTWVRKTMEVASLLLSEGGAYYPERGLTLPDDDLPPMKGVVISDVRHDNEARAVKAAGGQIWCKASSGYSTMTHSSEAGISEKFVDVWIPWVDDAASVEHQVNIRM